MRAGKSLLLDHIVAAEDLERDAVAKLVVVCPACSSPLFKTERPRKDGTSQHFLSHFHRSPEDVEICELRVESMLRSISVTEEEKKAKVNNLRYFLAVLDEMVAEAVHGYLRPAPALQESMRQNFALNDILSNMVKTMRRDTNEHGAYRLFNDDRIALFKSFGRFAYRVPRLDIRRQRSYAQDFAEMLLTPTCGAEAMRIMRFAWRCTLVHMMQSDPESNDGLPFTSFPILKAITDRHPGADVDDPEIDAALPHVTSFLVQILLAIDYGEWLKRRLDDPRLAALRWKPPAPAPTKPKRKPKPKRTHHRR